MHKYIPEYLVDEEEDEDVGLRPRADAKGDAMLQKQSWQYFNTHYKVVPSLPLMGKIGLSR